MGRTGSGHQPVRRPSSRAADASAADFLRRITADSCPPPGDRRRHRGPFGGHRLRRNGVGQVDPTAQNLPRNGTRRGRHDRPHATPAARRADDRHAMAEEIGSPLGQRRRLQNPLHRPHAPETYVKLMTDGILLAETPSDRFLNQYDTIILDEAHERSLNIDFLLGYLQRLLPKRRELRCIITSATIDAARFSEHFLPVTGETPVIEVSGRTYPVEVRYRPPELLPEETEPEFPIEIDRRRRRTDARSSRATCWCSCPPNATSAKRPRCCGGRAATSLGRPGDPAAVRPALGQGTESRLRTAHAAPSRPGHQRGRIVADRARHPLRGRHRHGPHQPLLAAFQGPATADRSRSPGPRPISAKGVAAAWARHLHSPLQRRGLSWPRRVHHSRNSPHESGRRDPADARAETGRDRGLSVSRSAAGRRHSRRLQDAVRIGGHRSEPRADDRWDANWPACRSTRASVA